MLETRVQPLGQEDPLEKEMATHSSTRAWKPPWTEEPGRLQTLGSQSDLTEQLYLQLSIWLAISSPSVLYSSHHLTDVFSGHKKVCTAPLHSQIFHLPLLFLLRSTIYCNCIQTATYNIFYISAFAVYDLFPY